MVKVKEVLSKTDVIEMCTSKKVTTKWKFYNLTNSTVFAASPKNVPIGCRDAVLPEPLLKNRTVKSLIFRKKIQDNLNDNSCLFGALALHLHGNHKLEGKTSIMFYLFITKVERCEPDQFQGVQMNDLSIAEDLLRLSFSFME